MKTAAIIGFQIKRNEYYCLVISFPQYIIYKKDNIEYKCCAKFSIMVNKFN
jgi:hypothetical protein